MIEGRIVGFACACHGSTGNRTGVELLIGSVPIVIVLRTEYYEDDIKVRCDISGGKKATEPISGNCNASVVTVIFDIGLCRDYVRSWWDLSQQQCLRYTMQMLEPSRGEISLLS